MLSPNGGEEAHAGSVMASYNEIDGVPSHINHWLLDKVLRQEWGFRGYVTSDGNGLQMLAHGHAILTDDDLIGIGIRLIGPPGSSMFGRVKDGGIVGKCRVVDANLERQRGERPDPGTAMRRWNRRRATARSRATGRKNAGSLLALA